MFLLFVSFSYCYYSNDVLGSYKTDKPPFNPVDRHSWSYDRRNHEDNINFRNAKEIVRENPEPSYFDQQVQITNLFDAALSGYSSRFNKFRRINNRMNNIRLAIKQNECVVNDKYVGEEPLNVVSWLYEDNEEEKKMDKDLQREVENNVMHAKEKRDRLMIMAEEHLKNRRLEDREHKNRFLQWARHEYNVE
ncbi:hypothetical protein THOM_0333 [Trachipleistophora hominis]|uniref:Uncharacterized protein n=1 Tax=Trachipleistophora hominis TaxID=72359 RepID=L7K0D3_TRAHO|nr:hypothetical protein THOM_0333 [Trachipleistophora hominis]